MANNSKDNPMPKPAKMMVFTIGYQHYACTPDQAVALLAAIAPLRPVSLKNYREPYIFQEEDGEIISQMTLAPCIEPELPDPAVEPERLAITDQTTRLIADETMPF